MSLPPIAPVFGAEIFRLFADTAALYRRCFRQLVALGAISALVAGGTGLTLFLLYAPTVMTAVVSFNAAGLASGVLLVAAGAWLASMLVTVQCGAMVAQVASRVADGGSPDLRSAWRETVTVVPRLILPCLGLGAGTSLVAAVSITMFLNALGAARLSASMDCTAALSMIFGLFGALALGVLLSLAITWWLRVKLFLLLPAASLEKLPGNAPVKRSWQLTRGRAGLVFCTLAVIGLGEAAVVGLGSQMAMALVTPASNDGEFAGLVTLVSQLMPAMAITTVVGAAVTTLTWPFLTVASTLLHRAVTGYRLTPLMSG